MDHLIRNLIDCRIITFRDIERIRQDLKKEGRIHDVSDFMGEESFRIDNTEKPGYTLIGRESIK